MTLVAALKSTGVPAMIGDFLISNATTRFRGRKKISRLRQNVATGWSSADMSFRYVEEVLYFVVVCHVDAAGAVVGRPVVAKDDIVHYQTMDECSVLTFSRPVGDADYTMWAMVPVGVPYSAADLTTGMQRASSGAMNMAADYYAASLVVNGPHARTPMTPVVQCPWDKYKPFRGMRGRLEVALPQEIFEVSFRERAVPIDSIPGVLKPLADLLEGK